MNNINFKKFQIIINTRKFGSSAKIASPASPRKQRTIFKKTNICKIRYKEVIARGIPEDSRFYNLAGSLNAELQKLNSSIENNKEIKITYKSCSQIAALRMVIAGGVLVRGAAKLNILLNGINLNKIFNFTQFFTNGILNCSQLKSLKPPRMREAIVIYTFCNKLLIHNPLYDLQSNGFILKSTNSEMILSVMHLLALANVDDLNEVVELIIFVTNNKSSVKALKTEIERRKKI